MVDYTLGGGGSRHYDSGGFVTRINAALSEDARKTGLADYQAARVLRLRSVFNVVSGFGAALM